MTANAAPRLRDRHVLHKTIFRYTLFSRIIALIVVLVVIFAWWRGLLRVLQFGRTRDYTTFDVLGPDILSWIQKYNPFFWWGLVVLGSLIILYFLYQFVVFMHRRSQLRPISSLTCEHLLQQLSPPSQEVLDWVWENRKEPITVGVLQRTLAALRQGRYQQIKLCQQHKALLHKAKEKHQLNQKSTKEVLHTF